MKNIVIIFTIVTNHVIGMSLPLRDGDIILTKDHFIFYVFGYDHPVDKSIGYLKYIPREKADEFDLEWINFEWNLEKQAFIRPKQLYTPRNFQKIKRVFKTQYPQYLYRDPFIGKTVFVIPVNQIETVFIPEIRLQEMLNNPAPSALEREAIDLIKLIAQYAKVPLANFGIHGSLSTGMATESSDIDIAVYGATQYLKVKKGVFQLYQDGKIEYLGEIKSDDYRMNKCEYKGRKFVFNAIRRREEIHNTYGQYKFTPIRPIHFYCDIVRSDERMFRPAIYHVEEYFPVDEKSSLVKAFWPSQIVVMVGEFRDIAKKGDEVEVQGMLEKVESVNGKEIFYRVVIGSGQGNEFMWPV
ncbi:MAG: nucleotidyltransferase domain-containing protein [Candidatus Helarchaeota archaeon]